MKPDNSTPEMYERWEEEKEEEGVKIKWMASRPGREQGIEGDSGGQRAEDGLVRGAGCRECGVPGLPAGARRGEDGR